MPWLIYPPGNEPLVPTGFKIIHYVHLVSNLVTLLIQTHCWISYKKYLSLSPSETILNCEIVLIP